MTVLPAYQALQIALAGRPERVMGDAVIPAEPPDWGAVERLCEQLGGDASPHLAIATASIRAACARRGYPGLEDALTSLLFRLDQHWAALQPEPDEDDPDDPWYERVNLLRDLADSPEFLDLLHRTPVVSVRGLGDFSTRDFEIALGQREGDAEERVRNAEPIVRGAVQDLDPESLTEARLRLERLQALIAQVENVFAERSGQAGELSLARLRERLAHTRTRLLEVAGGAMPDDATSSEADTGLAAAVDDPTVQADGHDDRDPTAAPAAVLPTMNVGVLADHAACRDAFEAIHRYYRRHEPSSPLSLLAARGHEMVGLGFFEVVQAMVPNGDGSLGDLLAALDERPLGVLLDDCRRKPPTLHASDDGTVADTPPCTEVGRVTIPANRADVVVLLDEIERFHREREPSSPIPLLVNDMKRLVPRSFRDLLREFRTESSGAEAAAS